MKIGIQPTPIGFTNFWIDYCKKNKIDYKLVNCYKNDIIDQLEDCDAFMWNHDLLLIKDNLIAKRLLFSIEHSGKAVFPSFYSGWHYDDKIGQKYLLEALKVPSIPTYLFFDKIEAKQWACSVTYPKVFKLNGGAGSSNVSLIKNKKEAFKVINKAFSTGFDSLKKNYFFKESIRKYKEKKITTLQLLKSFVRYLIPKNKNFIDHKEKHYVYFQEFIANNDGDYRIVVINQNKAFGIKRYNRKNDFRASGSGEIEYLNPKNVKLECIETALQVSKKIKMNSIAYDFVFDKNNKPVIIEISYAFGSKSSKANGYWDENLTWHNKKILMQEWMIEQFLSKINIKSS